MVNNQASDAGEVREVGSNPGSRRLRSPGEGYGHPLQYSCLDTSVNRGAWQASLAKSQTPLKQLSTRKLNS